MTINSTILIGQINIENDTGEIPAYLHKPDNIIGGNPEVFPIYKFGGEIGMMKFLNENIKYPKDSVEGKVFVTFIVDTLGNVRRPKILRGLSKKADEEVLRVVKLLEFYPAMTNNKKLAIDYNLPVSFSLNKNDKNKK